MAVITLRNPATGEQQAIDDAGYVTPVAEGDPWFGWEKIADGLPLDDLKAQAWERVKAIRAAKEDGTCSTPVGTVQIDAASKLNITGALSLCRLQEELSQAFSLNFTLADNSRVTLDNTTVRQLAGAVGEYVSALYDHAASLRDQINAAADPSALDAIDLTAGWPT